MGNLVYEDIEKNIKEGKYNAKDTEEYIKKQRDFHKDLKEAFENSTLRTLTDEQWNCLSDFGYRETAQPLGVMREIRGYEKLIKLLLK